MLLHLACPSCLDARERETVEYRQGVPCSSCQALLLFRIDRGAVQLVVKCRGCGHVFQGMEGRDHLYSDDYRCPKCKLQTYPVIPYKAGERPALAPLAGQV